jgi:hypothetical protein
MGRTVYPPDSPGVIGHHLRVEPLLNQTSQETKLKKKINVQAQAQYVYRTHHDK